MNWLHEIVFRLRAVVGKRHRNRMLDEELKTHLALLVEQNVARGMSLEAARREAKLSLGGADQIKESVHDHRGLPLLETFVQDLRYALRVLRKSPGFTAVTVLTLALGIGANTAIFTVLDAVMLRSMPAQDPQNLVVFRWTAHTKPKFRGYSSHSDCAGVERRGIGCSFSAPFFRTLRAQTTAFSGVTAFSGPGSFDLSGNGPASLARGEFVSGDFFSTMGVKTILGRPIGPSDDSASATPVIVLDYGYWQRAFGGDPAAVGRTVQLDGVLTQIVGVADRRFTNIVPGIPEDFFLPLSHVEQIKPRYWVASNKLSDSGQWWVVIVGRLKPSVSIGQAQAEATTIFRNEMLHGAAPLSKETDAPAISLASVQEGLTGERAYIAPMLYIMMYAVGFVLLIACANVAGLTLARSANRKKEIAVRLALGAGRKRIVRQLLTESVLLSVIGGMLGIFVAAGGVGFLIHLLGGDGDAFSFTVGPDWRVLTFTIGVTFITGILFGLAPALRSTRVDMTPALKDAAPSSSRIVRVGRWLRLGDALVIVQVALSIVVLVGAGLLFRTMRNFREINPGFDTQNVLLFGLEPSLAGYKDAQTAELYRNLQERFAALPGIISASYSSEALLAGSRDGIEIHLDDTPPQSHVNADYLAVGLNFFSTLRIPLLAGRAFTDADFESAAATGAAKESAAAQAAVQASASTAHANAPLLGALGTATAPVPTIVNESFVREFFHAGNPIGRHIGEYESENPGPWPHPGYIVIGVVGDTKYSSLGRAIKPLMFLPLTAGGAHFELRAAANPTALVKSVREIVFQADHNLPVVEMLTQTEQVDQLLSGTRVMSQLSSFFALLALVLACIGLYGLLAYEVARRTREIGIRMALGAQRREVMRLVLRHGIVVALAGALAGIAAAIALGRFIASMLYQVRPNDPLTIVGVAFLLIIVALAACYVPARRAMRVDPMVALRHE